MAGIGSSRTETFVSYRYWYDNTQGEPYLMVLLNLENTWGTLQIHGKHLAFAQDGPDLLVDFDGQRMRVPNTCWAWYVCEPAY